MSRDNRSASPLFRTTAFKLAMGYAAFFCLLSAACLALLYWVITSELDAQIDAGLRAEMAALTRLYADKGVDGLRGAVASRSTWMSLAASDTGDTGPRQYLLTDAAGRVLAGTMKDWPAALPAARERWATLPLMLPVDQPGLDEDGPQVRVRLDAVTLPGGYRLLVGQSLNETDELRETLLTLTSATVLFTLLVGAGGGALMGRSVVRRLQQVTLAADRIMTGDLAQRIPVEGGHDEYDALAAKLNSMLQRIEELMRRTREVTENVAHDLRSPLGRLRSRLETLSRGTGGGEREALQKAIEETDRIVATLNGILSIAEIGARSRGSWETLDVTSVCRDVAELYDAVAEEKRIALGIELAEGVKAAGNRQLLAQAVSNLLDNAIKYTPPGGRVALRLTPRAEITVADSGPGIPAEMRGKVLERFVRLDTSRSQPGNGLGLSLVAAVAEHHGATLVLADNGPGLKATLQLTAG
ncbi:MAG TPA: HAMP domain-containing sensor histidine kinase [Gammaproteobacteria bacterium]|nr:HAMP domain-containing sensor histidine kinase [Gammaproteobacteria bacterium]